MNENRGNETLREVAQDYNAPPPTPRERMWARIDAARASERGVIRPRFWHRRTIWWPAAAAAVLILGIVIGRFSAIEPVPESFSPDLTVATESTPSATVSADQRHDFYHRAATPLLGRAELLLTQFRADAEPVTNGDGFSHRAAGLLMETRLLLDSPAAENAELCRLLNDLELVLAQIVRVTARQESPERERIKAHLARKALLPRLQSQVPSAPAASRL